MLERISLAEMNEVSDLDETQQGKKGFGSTGVSEDEGKEQKKKRREVWFDKSEPEHKGVQEKILPERVDTRARSSKAWSNTIDPWMCQWIKRVGDQKDEKCAIKHIRSFMHKSWIEQVNSQLVQQLKSLTNNEAQFIL